MLKKPLSIFVPVAATVNVIYECFEAHRLGSMSWTWLGFLASSLILAEILEHEQWLATLELDDGSFKQRIWIARIALVALIASMRVDADVRNSAIQKVHRSELREALLEEDAGLRLLQDAMRDSHRKHYDYLAVSERQKVVSSILYRIESFQNLDNVANTLDRDCLKSRCIGAPQGGYSQLINMPILISSEQHLAEWALHLGDLLLLISLLLFPYLAAQAAMRSLENPAAHKPPDHPDVP